MYFNVIQLYRKGGVYMNKKSKPVYMYSLDDKLIKKFETTMDCADYFDKEPEYINHNLKYCDKIRKDGKWYRIRRIEL